MDKLQLLSAGRVCYFPHQLFAADCAAVDTLERATRKLLWFASQTGFLRLNNLDGEINEDLSVGRVSSQSLKSWQSMSAFIRMTFGAQSKCSLLVKKGIWQGAERREL